MAQKLFFYLLLLLFANSCMAQKDSIVASNSVKPKYYSLPKATLKLNIPCLLDPFRNSIHISSDIKISKKFMLEPGIGYFFGASGRNFIEDEKLSGVRSRLALKFFFFSKKHISLFVGAEAMHNYITTQYYEQLCRYGCQYDELYLTNNSIHAFGGAFKYGIQSYFGKKRNLFLDFYIGIGYKYTNKTSSVPKDAEIGMRNSWIEIQPERRAGIYHDPNILWGFSFGYCFR